MYEVEYKDNEEVLYKTKCKLGLTNKELEEVECYVTQGHVVIEAEEPLKIPLVSIKDWSVRTKMENIWAGQQAVPGTITLRYRDASGYGQKVEFEMGAYDAGALASALKGARDAPEIAQHRLRWRDVWSRGLPYQTPSAVKLTKTYDETRDKLCADLCAIGLDARMIVRGQLQEVIDADWGAQPFSETPTSLGLIEVRRSPIRLVNVLTKSYHTQYGYKDFYKNVYLVPDSTIFPDSTMFWEGYEMPVHGYGRSVRVKNVPLFGRVVDLRWKGEFEGDLILRLGQDVLLNQTLIRLKEDMEIWSYPEYGCWTISSPSNQDEPAPPSREKWDCYERIARHLLKTNVK